MRIVKRMTFAVLAIAFFLAGFSGCEKSTKTQLIDPETYQSFRDIPGVSADEIKAIEALKTKYDHFVYAMPPSTEAFVGENFKIAGFSALFCDWLTDIFGIRFKPVLYQWGDLLEGLGTGEIDFTGEMAASEERKLKYFMTDAIAERPVTQFRLVDSRPLSEIAEERPLRFAFLAGTNTIDLVVSSLEPGSFEVITVPESKVAYDLLKDNKVDAFVNEGMVEASFDTYGNITAEDFHPQIFSPVSLTTQKPELAPVISVIQKALENGSIRHLTKLYNDGYRSYLKHKLVMHLSEEERIYIIKHPEVSLAAESDNYPLSFYNRRDKQWQGIVFDILDQVGKLTGLTFVRINDEHTTWPELFKMFEAGKASMISELIRSKDREGRFLWPQNAIMSDKAALISSDGFRNIGVNEIP